MTATDQHLDTEELCDEINARLESHIKAINGLLESAEYLRPYELSQLIGAFIKALSLVVDLDPEFVRTALADNRDEWSEEAIGELLLGLPITERGEKLDRHLAVEVADVLGPDNAQAWYHFIVLVTKLA